MLVVKSDMEDFAADGALVMIGLDSGMSRYPNDCQFMRQRLKRLTVIDKIKNEG